MAYQMGEVTLQSKVKVRIEREWEGKKYRRVIDTSVGRLIFNDAIPQDPGLCAAGYAGRHVQAGDR